MGDGEGGALCPRQILLFVVGASEIWESEISKIYQGFWIKNFFSIILYLGGSGPFVRISEIWKMVFTWFMSKFSQQKLKLLVIYGLFVSSMIMTHSEYINCTNVNSFKWFLVTRCYCRGRS